MRYILPIIFFLSACAHDNYVVTPKGHGSQERLVNDLHLCKEEVNHVYFSDKPDTGFLAGAAGALGGGIGGALVGAGTGLSTPSNSMKLSDVDPYIEKCMLKKGYIGTSEN